MSEGSTALPKFNPSTAKDGSFKLTHIAADGTESLVKDGMPLLISTVDLPNVNITGLRNAGVELLDQGLTATSLSASAIANIDGPNGKLWYRGYAIEDLAANCRHTEVSYLVMYGELPNEEQLAAFEETLAALGDVSAEIEPLANAYAAMPEGKRPHPMKFMQAAYALLDPARESEPRNPEQLEEACLKAIAAAPMIAAYAYKAFLGHGENYKIEHDSSLYFTDNFAQMLYQATGNEKFLVPEVIRGLDSYLVTHAEHEHNLGTSTAKMTQSGGANLFDCISSALGSLSGPEHGGANEAVQKQLDYINSLDGANIQEKVAAFLVEKVNATTADDKLIMGIGHRVYTGEGTIDPRAPIMKEKAEALIVSLKERGMDVDPVTLARLEAAAELQKQCAEHPKYKKFPPNVDFWSFGLSSSAGFITEMMTPIFGVARTSGYSAHIYEIRCEKPLEVEGRGAVKFQGPIWRGRQNYVGETPRPLPSEFGVRAGKDAPLFEIKERGIAA